MVLHLIFTKAIPQPKKKNAVKGKVFMVLNMATLVHIIIFETFKS